MCGCRLCQVAYCAVKDDANEIGFTAYDFVELYGHRALHRGVERDLAILRGLEHGWRTVDNKQDAVAATPLGL